MLFIKLCFLKFGHHYCTTIAQLRQKSHAVLFLNITKQRQLKWLVFADEFWHRELCHSVSKAACSSPRFWPIQDLTRALRYCYTTEAWQSGRWEFTYSPSIWCLSNKLLLKKISGSCLQKCLTLLVSPFVSFLSYTFIWILIPIPLNY